MTTTEIVPATASEARDLTDRIKFAVDGTWQLIKQAYLSRVWDALGYDSWDDYCTREFGTSRLRLPREERQEVVASLREIGMSTRAIAAATGTGTRQVQEALRSGVVSDHTSLEPRQIRSIQGDAMDGSQTAQRSEAADDEKEVPRVAPRVTGMDGKSYTAKPSRSEQRPKLAPQFATATGTLTRAVARIDQLRADDRFRVNRTVIADQCVPQLRRALEVLSDLMDYLGEDDGGLT